MQLDVVRAYCLGKAGAEESLPFGPDALVFKVRGKIFGILALKGPPFRLSLKCDPERAVELREMHPAVEPGYHLNKRHWNTVTLDGSVGRIEIEQWIDHSYERVVEGLPKREREALSSPRP